MQTENEIRKELGIRATFPGVVDSSMLSSFRACPYRAYLTYFEHWKPKFESVHLVAGGAFAKGIEVARRTFYELGRDAKDAEALGLQALITHYGDFEGPPESAKSLPRMIGALEFYLSHYPLGRDGSEPITLPTGRRGIEFSFVEPLDIVHPITGEPLLFSGRADMVASFAGGVYCFDEKTTSQLGQKWGDQWDLRSQFTAYCWAGRRLGIHAQGAIVRGISILKTKYETAQAITYRADWELDRWEELMLAKVGEMVSRFERSLFPQDLDGSCTRNGNPWDRNTDSACNDYGGCPFRKVCKARNPYDILLQDFDRRVWEPIQHKEIPLAEWEKEFGQ